MKKFIRLSQINNLSMDHYSNINVPTPMPPAYLDPIEKRRWQFIYKLGITNDPALRFYKNDYLKWNNIKKTVEVDTLLRNKILKEQQRNLNNMKQYLRTYKYNQVPYKRQFINKQNIPTSNFQNNFLDIIDVDKNITTPLSKYVSENYTPFNYNIKTTPSYNRRHNPLYEEMKAAGIFRG